MVATLLLASLAAWAQADPQSSLPAVNAQNYRPPMDTTLLLWTEEASARPPGTAAGRMVLSYARDPLVYRWDDAERVAVVTDIVQADAIATWTQGPIRFGLDVPLILRTGGELTGGQTGTGDVAADVKGSVFSRDEDGVGFAIGGRLSVPTTSVDVPVGEPGLGWEVQALVDGSVGPMLLAANVGTRGLPSAALENVAWDDQFFFRAGAAVEAWEDAGVSFDLAGNFTYGQAANPAGRPMEALVGGWGRLGDSPWALRGGLGSGISGGIGAPRARLVLALAWEPPR